MAAFFIIPGIIVSCIAIQAFFAASEMALISFDYIRLKNRSDNGDRKARQIIFFLEHPDILFGTTLLGVNLAIILNSASASYLSQSIITYFHLDLPAGVQMIVSSAAVMPLILFFGEFLPMGYSRLNPAWFETAGIKLFRMLYLSLFPLVKLTSYVSRLIYRIMKADPQFHASLVTRDALESYIADSLAVQPHSLYSLNVEQVIKETFEFSQTAAESAMIPLSGVKSLPESAVKEDVFRISAKTGFTRIPVYRDRPDVFTGYINSMDFLSLPNGTPVSEKLLPPIIAPAGTLLPDILSRMKSQDEQMAFLTDPDGTVIGIITDEDAMEEILGFIYDEFDEVRGVKDGVKDLILDGNIRIHELNRKYKLNIPESHAYRTLAGFILHHIKRIPSAGQVLTHSGMVFRIEQATGTKIKKVNITQLRRRETEPAAAQKKASDR